MFERRLLGRQSQREGHVHPAQQPGVIRLFAAAFRHVLVHLGGDRFRDDLVDELARIVGVQDLVAVAVDDFPLLVHHVIVLKRVLAAHVVALLDAFLRVFDAAVQPRVFQFLAVFQAELFHDGGHAVRRAEVAHQVVLEADVEARRAGVALARATAA